MKCFPLHNSMQKNCVCFYLSFAHHAFANENYVEIDRDDILMSSLWLLWQPISHVRRSTTAEWKCHFGRFRISSHRVKCEPSCLLKMISLQRNTCCVVYMYVVSRTQKRDKLMVKVDVLYDFLVSKTFPICWRC